MAYRAILASNTGTVVRWDNGEATGVAIERRKHKSEARTTAMASAKLLGTAAAAAVAAVLAAGERGGEAEKQNENVSAGVHGWTLEPDVGVWQPDVASAVRAPATRDGHAAVTI